MKTWKIVLTTLAMFGAGVLANAAEPPDEGIHRGDYAPEPGDFVTRPGQGHPGWNPKVMDIARPLTVVAISTNLQLTPEETEKLRKAYTTASEESWARWKEAGDDREKWRTIEAENRKAMRSALESSLGEEKGRRAAAILGPGGVEESMVFFAGRNVENAKLKEAVPVIVKYHAGSADLRRQTRDASAEERKEFMAKRGELRQATIRDLAPIVGEEAAKAWAGLAEKREQMRRESRGGAGAP
jgi:hypothetical protein